MSILVALDLMRSQKRLDQITLEPADHQDLAGDLNDETHVRGATRITIDGYRRILQAKLRNIEPQGHR